MSALLKLGLRLAFEEARFRRADGSLAVHRDAPALGHHRGHEFPGSGPFENPRTHQRILIVRLVFASPGVEDPGRAGQLAPIVDQEVGT